MIDLKQLGFPETIIDSVNEFGDDISIDNYSFRGANGYVLFGKHNLLKKRVALKYYYYGSNAHEEVQLLSQLENLNILNVYNARTIDDEYAFFMADEKLGGDLDDFINSPITSLRLSIEITRGILCGLIEMHRDEFRLLHRDLKPANILIDEHNRPIIADFGSVKRIPDNEEYVNGSRHAVLYRPPEAFDNEYSYTGDIYQVGLVLYQLCGGYLPYNELAYLKPGQLKKYQKLQSDYDKSKFVDRIIEERVKKGKLINLDSLLPFVPKSLKRIIKKSTHPDSTKRFSNCSEFELALHKLGSVPDWFKRAEGYFLNQYNGNDYKVCHRKKDMFCCEKRGKKGIWRKESKIHLDSEVGVVKQMVEKICA